MTIMIAIQIIFVTQYRYRQGFSRKNIGDIAPDARQYRSRCLFRKVSAIPIAILKKYRRLSEQR